MTEAKKEKLSPFVWVDALCQKTGNLIEEHGEEAYPEFMVTRAMSQYQDCILYAAELNLYRDLPKKMQHDYYMSAIRKKKRFAKWGKKKTGEGEVAAIMSHYNYSRVKAEEALRVLTPEQVAYIVELEKVKNASL